MLAHNHITTQTEHVRLDGSRGILLLVLVWLFAPHGAMAAIVHCGATASGNGSGSDWNNLAALSTLTLVRGNTYYLATGSYGSKDWNTPASGTTLITIKKAVAGDHGSDVGWSSTLGTGQAVFTFWGISTSYWTFDGQVGGGPGSWEAGHGIAVRNLSDHLIVLNNTIANLTLLHIEVDGTDNTAFDRDAFYGLSGATNLTVRYSYFHDIGCDIWQIRGDFTNVLFEYSEMARNNQGTCHGDVFEYDNGTASGWVIRYNWFRDCVATYFFGTFDTGTYTGAQIYGNLISGGMADNGLVSAISAGGVVTGLQLYNNTIVNLSGNAGFAYLDRGINNRVNNNLWYNCPSVSMDGTTHDYNWFFGSGPQSETHIQNGTGNPFVNLAGNDYRLTTATQSGMTLASPFNMDSLGNMRGADGVWDRGAYEFASGAPPPPPPSGSACDVNKDNTTNIVDVQQCVNQSLGVAACTADINKDGICNVVDVQRVVNAALGGQCVSP